MNTSQLLPIQNKNASLTMSSREIAELLESDLVSILQKTKWFDALNNTLIGLNDASILSFCLCKEIQKQVTIIYDKSLQLAIRNQFLEIRDLSSRIEDLRCIAMSAKYWFKSYPVLSEAFEYLTKVISEIYCGLIITTSPVNSKKSHDNEKTYIVYNPKSDQIKIGKSISPQQRIRMLETQSGANFDVLAIIDCNRETELHRRFKKYRTVGEWFKDKDGVIRKFVQTLDKGSNQ